MLSIKYHVNVIQGLQTKSARYSCFVYSKFAWSNSFEFWQPKLLIYTEHSVVLSASWGKKALF